MGTAIITRLAVPLAALLLGCAAAAGAASDRESLAGLWAMRPDYSGATLSPRGTRVALVARLKGGTTTLLVVDVSGGKPAPLFRVDVPLLVGVQDYAWLDEDHLVAWFTARRADSDTTTAAFQGEPASGGRSAQASSATSSSEGTSTRSQATSLSDSGPDPDALQPPALGFGAASELVDAVNYYTYVATIDVQARRVERRTGLVEPTATALVRGQLGTGARVLLGECFGRLLAPTTPGGLPSDASGTASDDRLGGASTSRATRYCGIKSWDGKGTAREVGPEAYGQALQFAAAASGHRATLAGVDTRGQPQAGNWQEGDTAWSTQPLGASGTLPDERGRGALDDPALWNKLLSAIPLAGEPTGHVITTSGTLTPVGLQLLAPEERLVLLDRQLAQPMSSISEAVGDLSLDILSVSEARDVVLAATSGPGNGGAYIVWRKAGNTITKVVDRRALPAAVAATGHLEQGWLPGNLPVMVTRPAAGQRLRGIVFMPRLGSDAAINSLAGKLDTEVQWLVANGLAVVQFATGLPLRLAPEARGEPWWKSVGDRARALLARARQDAGKVAGDVQCLYGRGAEGYVALAAASHGSGIDCVVAINVPLDPASVASPWKRITTLEGLYFQGTDAAELERWRSVFGPDLAAAAPGSWQYTQGTQALLSWQMYDTRYRPLASQYTALADAIGRSHGWVEVHKPVTWTADIDAWNRRLYLATAEFLAPTKPPRRNRGIIIVDELAGAAR